MQHNITALLLGLLLSIFVATLAQDGSQAGGPANCQVKVVHLLEGGSPIDVRVGGVLVAANLAFLRSQTSQRNVPCGLQNIDLSGSGQNLVFRSDNFPMAEGDNVYNYIVFGGEIREPNDTNVFLLSAEPIAIPSTPEGQINLAFWHYTPLARQDQVQLDVENNGQTVLSTIANFQQRVEYMPVPAADALTFKLSNIALEELFTGERSVAALRNTGAGTVFAIGQNTTEVFIEADPANIVPGGGGGQSSDSSAPPPPPPPPPSFSDSSDPFGDNSVSSASSSSFEEPLPDIDSASSLSSFLFF